MLPCVKKGRNITRLVNFISDNPKKVMFHGTNVGLIQAQARAMGIELLQPVTSWDQYERDFKQTIAGLKPQGVMGMVFGDIYLQENLDWVQKVCSETVVHDGYRMLDIQEYELAPAWRTGFRSNRQV